VIFELGSVGLPWPGDPHRRPVLPCRPGDGGPSVLLR